MTKPKIIGLADLVEGLKGLGVDLGPEPLNLRHGELVLLLARAGGRVVLEAPLGEVALDGGAWVESFLFGRGGDWE